MFIFINWSQHLEVITLNANAHILYFNRVGSLLTRVPHLHVNTLHSQDHSKFMYFGWFQILQFLLKAHLDDIFYMPRLVVLQQLLQRSLYKCTTNNRLVLTLNPFAKYCTSALTADMHTSIYIYTTLLSISEIIVTEMGGEYDSFQFH